jgi:hypothetical protein
MSVSLSQNVHSIRLALPHLPNGAMLPVRDHTFISNAIATWAKNDRPKARRPGTLIDSSEGALWFVGDLSDPWVVSIAEVLARCTSIVQVHCAGELPECPYDVARPPRLVIVHRQRLTAADAQRLKGYRDPKPPAAAPAIILCVSPYVRYAELERWSGLASHVLFEATAGDVLPRHVAREAEGRDGRIAQVDQAGFRIEVAGSNRDLCEGLVAACVIAGYRAVAVDDLDAAGGFSSQPATPPSAERALTIWDVPVLEPDWAQRLERRTRSTGPVIALFGFADRDVVATARARGAVACLELPYDVDDLIDVVDRVGRSIPIDKWPVHVRLEPPHRLPPRPRRRKQQQEDTTTAAVPWSDRDRNPTID